jgi:hypothetical protein
MLVCDVRQGVQLVRRRITPPVFSPAQPAWFIPGESTSNPPLGFLRDSLLFGAATPSYEALLAHRKSREADTPNWFLSVC